MLSVVSILQSHTDVLPVAIELTDIRPLECSRKRHTYDTRTSSSNYNVIEVSPRVLKWT